MTIVNKLNQLLRIKNEVKDVIERKGVTVGNTPFTDYASKIDDILVNIEGISRPTTGFYLDYKIEDSYYTEIYGDMDTGLTPSYVVPFTNYRRNFIIKEGVVDLKSSLRGSSMNIGSKHSIDSISFPSTLEVISGFAMSYCVFNNELILPDSIKKLKTASFNNASISSILGKNIVQIESSSFQKVRKLDKVVMPKLTSVPYYGLQSTTNDRLKEVELGSVGYPVTNLADRCFGANPTLLTSLTIYVSDPSNPELVGVPWGATNATITYLQA